MLERLLMAVGGAAEFTPPPPTPPQAFTLTSAPNGGGSSWTNPRAVHVSGTTYFGWIDGNGNLECAERDSDGTQRGPYTISAGYSHDAHDSPAFVRRASDGRWLAFASRHNQGAMHVWVSTNPDDFSSWTGPTNLDSQLGGSRYTDYHVFARGSDVWLFVRDEPTAGTDSRWLTSHTTIATPTSGWSTLQNTFRIAGTRSYCIVEYDAVQDRLHLIATNAASAGFTKLGHMYRDMTAGTWHKDDGTTIALTANFTELTEIYTGTTNVFPVSMSFDGSGNPVVTVVQSNGYVYLINDGSSWDDTFVSGYGAGYSYNNDGNVQAWGGSVDDGDINIFWLLKDSDGVNPQLWRYVTTDGGATFTPTQVTSNQSGDQTSLVCVRDPAADFRVLWQSGSWTHYTNWNMGMSAVAA